MDITKLLTYEQEDYTIISYKQDDPLTKFILGTEFDQLAKDFTPYFIIYNSDSFLNPNWKTLKNYILSFHKILKRPQIIDKLFKIDRIIHTGSANGDIIVLSVRKGSINESPQILLKVPKAESSDPISHEYYIGLTLNNLRENTSYKAFAITYGLINCPMDFENNMICSYAPIPLISNSNSINRPLKTGIFYEFIRSPKEPTITLAQYIYNFNPKKSDNKFDYDKINRFNELMVSILKYVLLSLDSAQNQFNFTHYDLHLNNIILLKNDNIEKVEINKYTSSGVKTYKLYMEYTPIIIDYGRSYIDPNKVITSTSNFIDFSTQKMYLNFKEMIDDVWTYKTFRHTGNDYDNIIELLFTKVKLLEKLGLTQNQVLEKYYLATAKSTASGIDPTKFNKMFDAYRFTRSFFVVQF